MTSDRPHLRLPILGCEDAQKAESGSNQIKNKENATKATPEDIEAAQTLLRLHRDGVFAIRRLVNRHDGKVGPAVKTLLAHSLKNPLDLPKSAPEIERNQRASLKKKELSAALSLVKLSGRSRADSKAALALLRLRHECMVTLAHEQQKQVPLARLAIEKRNATERFLALERFRKEYPAVLRTSTRKGAITEQR